MSNKTKAIESDVLEVTGNGSGDAEVNEIHYETPEEKAAREAKEAAVAAAAAEAKAQAERDALRVEWPIGEAEMVAMVSAWMKEKHGVIGDEWSTNVPKSILRVSFLPGVK